MIPPNTLLILCLTTFVYCQLESGEQQHQQQDSAAYLTPYTGPHIMQHIPVSIEHNNKHVTHSLQQIETTQGPDHYVDEGSAIGVEDIVMPNYRAFDMLNETETDVPVNVDESYMGAEEATSTDNSFTDSSLQQADLQYQLRMNTLTTTTTDEPFITVVSTTTITTKSTPVAGGVQQRHKMGKTIKTYKSSADQVLRQFVENGYLRQPLACIVDTTENNLRKAQMLWNATLRSNVPIDILLSGYNSTGVGGTFSFKNTRTLLTGLSSMRESTRLSESGRGFTAVLKASELIPYDSAIFLSTDADPSDSDQFDRVATVLIKKRIRFYLIWFGESTFEENETSEKSGKTGGKLGELSLSTGGEILHIPNDALDKNGDLGLITLFARTGIQETVEYDVPNETYTVQPFYTSRPPIPTSQETVTELFTENLTHWDLQNLNSYELYQKIDNLIADEPQTYQQLLNATDEQVDLVFGSANTEASKRLARQNAEAITTIQPNINSQLLVNPGSTVRIVFDVTNLREQNNYHTFQVTGEKSWLVNFGPRFAWIAPKQTVQVTVLAQVPPNAEVGLTDKVTLISNSLTVVSQAVYVRVITGGALQDPHRPYLHYTYGSRCDGKTEAGTCSNGFWSLEITTQDAQTGILRVESEPPGLIIRTPFIAGTKEDVRATYTASCCDPRVTVTSYDVAKNPSTFTVDVRDVWIAPAGIAAITLGVLLGLLLILLLIALCVWCCRRNKESRDLPVYRSDSRTSRR